MRRIVSLAAAAALLSSIAVAGTASAAAPVYSTTVTVTCDGATPAMVIRVGFWKDDPGTRRNTPRNLEIVGTSTSPYGYQTCPDGTTGSLSASYTTRAAPGYVQIYWNDGLDPCTYALVYSIPTDTTASAGAGVCQRTGLRVQVALSVRT